MKVEILKDDPRFGISAGDVFTVKKYALDPNVKVTLLSKLDKNSGEFHPIEPCNQYMIDVKVLKG